MKELASRIHLVLRHDQVMGRGEKCIDSSVTQIDLHDFSRLTQTYGLGGFHCVTPLEGQHRICGEILSYWEEGYGRDYNPDRVQALKLLTLHRSFDEVIGQVRDQSGGKEPLLVATSAKSVFPEKEIAFHEFLSTIGRSGRPVLLQFGTSWGLNPEQLDRSDWILPPVKGHSGYNHLSVRCAAAIIVDRIFIAYQN